MSSKFPLIATAVAAALAAGVANAAPPTLADAQAPDIKFVMAGSSAAQTALQNYFSSATGLCGSGNTLTVKSAGSSKNFAAYSCRTAVGIAASTAGAAIPANTLITVYYRTEGGSVVGALPVASNHTIQRLNLSHSSCAAVGAVGTCTITATTTTIAGTTDVWNGAVTPDTVQLGVSDVEPGQLTGTDYPTDYQSSAFGSATAKQMQNLGSKKLFQQIFGLAINTSGSGLTVPVNLSKEAAANILSGTYSDWHQVPNADDGTTLSAAGKVITRINREAGSGTRTTANIYFLDYQCGSTNSIQTNPGEILNFSTGDALTAANNTPGSVVYTVVDQLLNTANSTNFANLTLAKINGVAASARAAAGGSYDYWFEAVLIPNTPANSIPNSLSAFLQGSLPKLSSAPDSPAINVIPGVAGNVASLPPPSNGGTFTQYINPYTRGSSSCNVPVGKN